MRKRKWKEILKILERIEERIDNLHQDVKDMRQDVREIKQIIADVRQDLGAFSYLHPIKKRKVTPVYGPRGGFSNPMRGIRHHDNFL